MTTILDQIVANKRREVEIAQTRRPLGSLRAVIDQIEAPRDFERAVASPSPRGPNLIAEVKRRSPSAGQIVADYDPGAIARIYHQHGAVAISVLTDAQYFGGSLADIEAVKRAVPLPVLRKDFTVDEYQIYESRAAGADAILLIAEVLDAAAIADLVPVCRSLGMAALVEVHCETHRDAVVRALGKPQLGHYLLGINNRDLAVQRTDVAHTARIACGLPDGSLFISESGIATRGHAIDVHRAGACAILVGEALLRGPDIGARVDDLLGNP